MRAGQSDEASVSTRRALLHAREALQQYSRHDCPVYATALSQALIEETLPATTDVYREMECIAWRDPQWAALSLIRSALEARETACQMADRTIESATQGDTALFQHIAAALAGRPHVFLSVLDAVFPDLIAPELRRDLQALSSAPVVDARRDDEGQVSIKLALLNVTALHFLLTGEMRRTALLEHANATKRAVVVDLLDKMHHESLYQLACSAAQLHERSVDVNQQCELLIQALRRFNRLTCERPLECSYHRRFGNYP